MKLPEREQKIHDSLPEPVRDMLAGVNAGTGNGGAALDMMQ